MPELAIYLLKINVAIVLFYFGYFFLLKRLTFYTINRFYLIFAMICSAVFPFLKLPAFLKKAEVVVYAFGNAESNTFLLPEFEHQTLFIWTALFYLYWLVVAVGGIKLIIRLVSLYRMRLQSSSQLWRGYTFRNLNTETAPFSFLKTIYLNREMHDDQELQTILTHEQVHTQGLHSLDVLLVEIWILFSWFNPLSYLLKKAIQVNIEFIADREVVVQGVSHQQYQISLLRSATQATHIPLVNQFSFISLKSRIFMMSKKQSSKKQLGKYVFLIPVIITSLFIFGVSKAYDDSKVVEFISHNVDVIENQISIISQDSVKLKSRTKDREAVLRVGDQEELTIKLQVDDRKESKGLIVRGIVSSDKDPLYFIDGVEQKKGGNMTLKSMNPADIESIEVLKDESATAVYGEKGKHGVILITTKRTANKNEVDEAVEQKATSSMSSPFTVSIDKDGNPFNRSTVTGRKIDGDTTIAKKVQIRFKKSEGTEVEEKASKLVVVGDSANVLRIMKDKKAPLYIIDGQSADELTMSKLSPDKINSVSVYKDAESIKRYGAKGKNGIIVIETKK